MKYILIFLAFVLNGCAVYLIKCDCPQKEVIKEYYPPFENFKPAPLPYIPYYPDWTDTCYIDSTWINLDWGTQ